MGIEATYDFRLKVVETLALSQDLATDPELIHELATLIRGKLDANSSTPATKVWSDTRSLTAGADSLDLTALTRGSAPTVDMTGLKLQLWLFAAAAGNTLPATITQGSSNPYLLLGGTVGGQTADAHPGGAIFYFGKDQLENVSATVKNIRVTSSDTDATYSIILVAG